MPPSDTAAEVEDLLLALFDAGQLRRFVRRSFGPDLARQLPGDGVPHERLAHEAALVLERNGVINTAFFEVLAGERQSQLDRINQTLLALDMPPLVPALAPGAGVGAGAVAPAQLPQRVIDDIYEDLVGQRNLLRVFIAGPYSAWGRATGAAIGRETPEQASATRDLQSWIEEHLFRFSDPSVRAALIFYKGRMADHPLADGPRMLLALAAMANDAKTKGPDHGAVLARWASLDNAQLYRLAVEVASKS